MTAIDEVQKIFHHSILVTWHVGKEKWIAECPALNIKAEFADYGELIEHLAQQLAKADPALVAMANQMKNSEV